MAADVRSWLTTSVVTLSLSLILFAYERALVPLYGTGPTNYHLAPILLSAMLASAGQPLHVSRRYSLLLSAIALSAAPKATYWVGVITSRRKQPIFGSAFTHASVLGPLAFVLTTYLVKSDSRIQQASRHSVLKHLGIAFISYWTTLQLSRALWPRVALLRRISDSQIHLTLAFLAYSVWIATYLKVTATSKHRVKTYQLKFMIFVALTASWFWLLQPILTSPILPHPLPAPYTRPDYPLRILSAEQSVTGLIIVAEVLPHERNAEVHSIRYLRASHSILGGVWLYGDLDNQQPMTDSFDTYLGDSIYAAFVLQEAVRFVNSTGRAGQMKDGLIIGLGVGISATAFHRYGISTTIVEIDPAVYDAARRYFDLPDPGPGRVFLEDARRWVSRQKLVDSKVLFDFVVHDCFSGGGIPEHIYTLEFWSDLSTLVEPEGVVAVNYAGIVKSESARLVLYTLLKVFGQCRAFHDRTESNELTRERYETHSTNMIIFCTRSRSPLTFRTAQDSDYLGSSLRRRVLASLADREVDIGSILDGDGDRYILRDGDGRLTRQQEGQGHYHWKVMREVLEDVHWETY
ncbi:hypothetical protein APHAL10511_002078 [Amanita phalloides]|nr:hypothetical protein APHAL10511_002078 [Amanita phalloides]